jgi:RNA polymerase sigma-70 factor (ECF subfamily)
MTAQLKTNCSGLADIELAALIARRDADAVRLVTTRNNQRLFRAAWSILRSRADSEDCVQSAYLKAFASIGEFEGRSSLSTWLTRIVINEALMRRRQTERQRRSLEERSVTMLDDYREKLMRGSEAATPDREYARAQLRLMLEQAIAGLPESFRLVFVMREIEGLSVEETAEALDLAPATVKTRDHRARKRLQEALAPDLKASLETIADFAGADCERMTECVVAAYCCER